MGALCRLVGSAGVRCGSSRGPARRPDVRALLGPEAPRVEPWLLRFSWRSATRSPSKKMLALGRGRRPVARRSRSRAGSALVGVWPGSAWAVVHPSRAGAGAPRHRVGGRGGWRSTLPGRAFGRPRWADAGVRWCRRGRHDRADGGHRADAATLCDGAGRATRVRRMTPRTCSTRRLRRRALKGVEVTARALATHLTGGDGVSRRRPRGGSSVTNVPFDISILRCSPPLLHGGRSFPRRALGGRTGATLRGRSRGRPTAPGRRRRDVVAPPRRGLAR